MRPIRQENVGYKNFSPNLNKSFTPLEGEKIQLISPKIVIA